MHVRLKKNRSGSISVIVVDKSSGRYKELHTVGIAKDESEIARFVRRGWSGYANMSWRCTQNLICMARIAWRANLK